MKTSIQGLSIGLCLLALLLLQPVWAESTSVQSPPGSSFGLSLHSRLNQFLELPPALSDLTGNPGVHFSSGDSIEATAVSARGFASPHRQRGSNIQKIRHIDVLGVSPHAEGTELTQLRVALADAVLKHVWKVAFSWRDNRHEAIALDDQTFRSIGIAKLVPGTGSTTAIEDTWWTVRMGLPQSGPSDYQIMSLVGTYAEGFAIYGHYSFGIRKIGGDPDKDLAIDPRSPWEEEEAPGFTDWKNEGDRLISGMHVWPLYDWLYTQTHFRGLDVKLHFLSATQEQAELMFALANRRNMKEMAPFEPARYNCATMGQLVFEGLRPVGEKLSAPHPLADIPDRLAKKINKRFDHIITVELPSQTEINGRVRTPDWSIIPAPDRATSLDYLELLKIPEIN